jgi:hypothetical protein
LPAAGGASMGKRCELAVNVSDCAEFGTWLQRLVSYQRRLHFVRGGAAIERIYTEMVVLQ